MKADASSSIVPILLLAIALGNLSLWRLNNIPRGGFKVETLAGWGGGGGKKRKRDEVMGEGVD